MRRKISLYIADQLVDLDDQSFILFTYQMDDLENPTVIRNSFSQQITLRGTAANNKIFGGSFKTDRVISYQGGQAGVDFNASQKTPFVIYDELGDILESGYVKLDSVIRKGADIQYKITLYGGLGSFFYALSYDENGNKRTLADLDYLETSDPESELDFVINAQAVRDAWERLGGGPQVATPTLSRNDVSISSGAQSVQLQVTDTDDAGWYVTASAPSGVEVTLSPTGSQTGSGTVTVGIPANTGGLRHVIVRLYSGGSLVDTCDISQAAGSAAADPTISPVSVNASGEAGTTVTLTITDVDNVGWRLYASNSGISFSRSSGTGSAAVVATLPKNISGSIRHLVIYLRHASTTAVYGYCDITQAVAAVTNPTISPSTASVPSTQSTVTLTITDQDNVGWRINNDTAGVTFSQTEGTGSATVIATIPANTGAARNIVISIRDASTTFGTCVVSQAARTVSAWSVRLEYPTVDEAAGTFPIYVKAEANEYWELADSLGILTFIPASGTGTGEEVEYMFDIPAYPATSYKSRTTTIYLGDGQALRDQVTLTQAYSWWIDFAGPLPAPAGSGTIEITAPEGEPWSIVVDDSSWLHVSALSGTGPASVPFTVDANTTGSERETEVYLYDGNGQLAGNQYIDIIQLEGTVTPSMTASKTAGISAAGENITLQISNPSGIAWSLRGLYADGDIEFSQGSGTSDATVTVTIPPNTTGNTLTGIEIRLRVNGSSVQTITLTQNA